MNRTSASRPEEILVAIWCTVMPVTGTILIPSVQGTVPAYVLAMVSLLFVFFRLRHGEISPAVFSYLRTLFMVGLLWFALLAASQLGLIVSDRHDFSDVYMVDPLDNHIVLRTSLFTQSLYLFVCVLIALYFRYFFREAWMKYVFWGGYLLAGYGIYEWTYFLIFHEPGDFLVNRTFGSTNHPASWSQGISIGGLSLLRIKSTLGEPGFFAGVVLPFLFLAQDYRKGVLAGMLVFTALLSTSTACYVGLLVCLGIKSVWARKIKVSHILTLLAVLLFLGGMDLFFPDTFNGMFLGKVEGDNTSGQMRVDGLAAMFSILGTFNPYEWLFGIGFGYTYLSVFMELLINCGLIGLGIFLFVLFRPIIQLPIKTHSEGLKLGLISLALLFALSLSELFLPTTWMFLGLAYRRLSGEPDAPAD